MTPYKNKIDAKIYGRKWQRLNKDTVNAKSRKWKQENKEHIASYDKIRNIVFPEILKAHNGARKLKIKEGSVCEICRSPDNLEKHHTDYNRPLFFRILCKTCHTRLHKLKEIK